MIDWELSFDKHVSSCCSRAVNKLHAVGHIATIIHKIIWD